MQNHIEAKIVHNESCLSHIIIIFMDPPLWLCIRYEIPTVFPSHRKITKHGDIERFEKSTARYYLDLEENKCSRNTISQQGL